ncbi:amino acid adenylation domain-containing protein [Cytobacillus kochii]|uniref:amino acid adenylation domain-containing protein n=1 Tax=Cytobacillus kochii TaxID=859143 RepID=UPI00402A75E2
MDESLEENVYLLPASFGQKRIWYFEKLFQKSPTYNIPFIFKLSGRLNENILELSIMKMIERHEIFRTTFLEVDGEPVQKVSVSSPTFKLIMKNKQEIEEEVKLEEYIQSFAKKAFDIEKGPLINFELIKIDEHFHYFLFNVHHIIYDAWSLDIFKKELLNIYTHLEKGDELQISDPEYHYADFANWESESLLDGKLEQSIGFWKEYLKDASPFLQLQADFPRPREQTYSGNNIRLSFPNELVGKVREYTQKSGSTMNAFFMAAYFILLYRYTGQKDIVIGSPISNRKAAFTEDMIGFIVNTLPIRMSLKPYSKFSSVLKKTIKSFLNVYENSTVPFERIVQEVNPKRENSYHPIFQVLFTYHEQGTEGEQCLKVEYEKINTGTSKFDKVLYINAEGNQAYAEIEYNPDILSKQSMERFINHYIQLVQDIMADPNKPISKLSFMSKHEIAELTSFNMKGRPPSYIHDRIAYHSLYKPNACAVKTDSGSYTFAELERKSNQIAAIIRRNGSKQGSIIGLSMSRTLEQIAAILGIIKSGCAYLPIDPALPVNRMNYMLSDANAPLLLTDKVVNQHGVPYQIINIKEAMQSELDKPLLCLKELPPDEMLAYVIYTSGSSGKPKGVKVTHASLLNHIDDYLEVFPYQESERVLQNINFTFDASITEIFGSLIGGGTLVLTKQENQFDIAYLANLMYQERVTRAQLFHSLIDKLNDQSLFNNNDSLRLVFTGGEALNRRIVEKFYGSINIDATLVNLYGPTEATVAASYHICSKTYPNVTMPIGKNFGGYQLIVLDENLQLVPKGVEGELFIGGPSVSQGYINNEELTKNTFITLDVSGKNQMFYKTGDIVKQLANNEFLFISRKDSQVKIRGFRIELNEIKSTILDYPEITDAAVVTHINNGENQIYAFLVKNKDSQIIAANIKRRLQQVLPHYMVPASFVWVDEIPLSSNGKLLVNELPFERNDLVSKVKLMPKSHVEIKLCHIWQEVLGIKELGVKEDFFDLGGYSIKAIEVVAAVRKEFNISMTISDLFKYRTIEQLSEFIEDGNKVKVDNNVVVLKQSDTTHPPLFLIHPGGGGALCYMPLVKDMSINLTIYGIESIGYGDNQQPLSTIQEMAVKYVEEVLKIQTEGPYRIAGWSMGGTIAVEMARILEERNYHVSSVILFDAHPFHNLQSVTNRDPLIVWAHSLGMDLEAFSQLSNKDKYAEVLERAIRKGVLPKGSEQEDVKRIIEVMGQNNIACESYKFVQEITSDLILFKCQKIDETQPHALVDENIWRNRTLGKVTVIPVDGNHNNLLESPHSVVIGTMMDQLLSLKEMKKIENDRKSQESPA